MTTEAQARAGWGHRSRNTGRCFYGDKESPCSPGRDPVFTHACVVHAAALREMRGDDPAPVRRTGRYGLGQPKSEEHRAAMSRAVQRRWADPTERARWVEAIRAAVAQRPPTGRPQSPETRAKIAATLRARWREAEYRAAHSGAQHWHARPRTASNP